MTIAISLKVNDGVVLAADSASTLFAPMPGGQQAVMNVYNNANKVFNLRKGLPLGAITWGSGSIGPMSISTLVKDLRRRFAGEDRNHRDWHLDPETYQVGEVAARLREFIFEERYPEAFKDWATKPPLGFVVAGYSAGDGMAEEYMVQALNGQCPEPALLRGKDESGMSWNGETEAISRLMQGVSPALPMVLQQNLGVPADDIPGIMDVVRQQLTLPLVMPAMPIQDAIDLAAFFVDLTIKFSRFAPGAPTVGGPVEVAVITKHEGFKWVRRKHYYTAEYNPPLPHKMEAE